MVCGLGNPHVYLVIHLWHLYHFGHKLGIKKPVAPKSYCSRDEYSQWKKIKDVPKQKHALDFESMVGERCGGCANRNCTPALRALGFCTLFFNKCCPCPTSPAVPAPRSYHNKCCPCPLSNDEDEGVGRTSWDPWASCGKSRGRAEGGWDVMLHMFMFIFTLKGKMWRSEPTIDTVVSEGPEVPGSSL